MNLTERMRKQQILGIVTMVYDIYESQLGRPPTSTEFFIALNHWQYFGKTPTLENITYGISKLQIKYDVDSRSFEREFNLIKNEDHTPYCNPDCEGKVVFCQGEYVLATKWGDGDPQDHWCVGYFDNMLGDRYIVVDENGKPFRANGFRKARAIGKEFGQFLISNTKKIEDSELPIWEYWFDKYPNYEKETQ